jgi:hypothetical protein
MLTDLIYELVELAAVVLGQSSPSASHLPASDARLRRARPPGEAT